MKLAWLSESRTAKRSKNEVRDKFSGWGLLNSSFHTPCALFWTSRQEFGIREDKGDILQGLWLSGDVASGALGFVVFVFFFLFPALISQLPDGRNLLQSSEPCPAGPGTTWSNTLNPEELCSSWQILMEEDFCAEAVPKNIFQLLKKHSL